MKTKENINKLRNFGNLCSIVWILLVFCRRRNFIQYSLAWDPRHEVWSSKRTVSAALVIARPCTLAWDPRHEVDIMEQQTYCLSGSGAS